MIRRSLPVLAIAASLALVAACGGSSGSAGPTIGGGSTPAPGATAAPATAAPGASNALPSIAIPTFNQDTDLEGLLPSEVNGVKLQKFSFKGTEFLGTSGNDEIKQLLTALNKSPDDLSLAFASFPTGGPEGGMGAYRIKGTDASAWLNTFLDIAKNDGSTVTQVSLGGKSVYKVVSEDQSETTYAYARGDVVFLVISDEEAQAAEWLALLP